MTFPAVHQRSSKVSSHSHERNSADERVREPKPHDLGLQISCCVHSEMSAQDAGPRAAPVFGEVFRKLALQKESKVEEGHLMPDHVHMLLSIPPKYAVSQVVGFIKGKSAIHVARVYGERRRNFVGQHFWARGREHGRARRGGDPRLIRNQENEDQRLEQMNLWR